MLDVAAANALAAQLASYSAQLSQAKRSISDYKNALQANWQSPEMSYIGRAADALLAKLDQSLRELDPLASDIRAAAAEIRSEQEAAAAAAAAKAAADAKAAEEARAASANSQRQQQAAQIGAELESARAAATDAKRALDEAKRQLEVAKKSPLAVILKPAAELAVAAAQKNCDGAAAKVSSLQSALNNLSK
ncbi:MAG: hypothetical protein LBS90_01345 [Oscillospiraceae bacterium]|jgi:chromosome segregation ATPase|nr:hypothetical protein [Oscillospiraceae bacterium]